MDKKQYILLSFLAGWISFFIFPIENPALTYFLGIFIGVISLFYIPYEKYTHNIMLQALLWSVVLFVFPVYLIAGLTVGVFSHIVIDLFKNHYEKMKFGFYQKRTLTASLIATNFAIVSGVLIVKFINF